MKSSIQKNCIKICLCVLFLLIFISTSLAQAPQASNKFCNIALVDVDANDCFIGISRFVQAARTRGIYEKMKLTILVNTDKAASPNAAKCKFYKQLYHDGAEIGVILSQDRNILAQWLSIPSEKILTTGFDLFGDADLESQSLLTKQGYHAALSACVEGNSLAEFWDIPHNWEGAPMFPYWTQWDQENPLSTDRTNRELDKNQAILELQWASRTLWHNYDRYPIPQCWHFGEPLKHSSWSVGQLVRLGQKAGWWTVELDQYEKNLKLGRTPFLYLNTASEGNIFSPTGPWKNWLHPDEALECALDLCQLMLQKGWRLTTVSEFVDWYARQWPCPHSPSMVYVMDDTLANRPDLEGRIIIGHGRLLHAETKYFQICDHENRIAPEMIVAYALKTPNLLRGGYTFANPEKWNSPQSKTGHYASTTGNAIFWSQMEPLKSVDNKYYFSPYKPKECRNRTFTFYLGDKWEPFQFASGGFCSVQRQGDTISWTKEMLSPVASTDIKVRYHHILQGPEHSIRIEVLGNDAVGLPARFRLCPYFHQGWDYAPKEPLNDPVVPDPAVVGQERNVFAQIGSDEFAFSESNKKLQTETYQLKPADGAAAGTFSIFNRNPGTSKTCDDNPAFNRGLTLKVNSATDTQVKCIDYPGPNLYVTVELDLGTHTAGRTYEFTFRYWHGTPPN